MELVLLVLLAPLGQLVQLVQYSTKFNNHIRKKTAVEIKHIELKEMRQQLDILKNKPDNQALVNDKLTRQPTLNKMSFMKKYTWVSFLVLLFTYYVYDEVRILFNTPWWLHGFTVLVMTLTVCFGVYINHVNKKEFLSGDLIVASLQMRKTKRLCERFFSCGTIIVTVRTSRLFIETYYGSDAANGGDRISTFHGMIVGDGIGLIVGVAIDVRLYFRVQRTNSDIIQQINESKKETE